MQASAYGAREQLNATPLVFLQLATATRWPRQRRVAQPLLIRLPRLKPSHHHIITSSDYHIITSSHHYVITSSHHHIITSSHHYVMCTCSSQLCYARNACCACYVCYMRHDSCVPAVVQARPVMRRAVASAVASRRSALGRGIAIGAAAVAGGTTSGAAAAAGPRRRRGRGAGAGTTAHLQAQGEAGGWCHTTGVLRVGLGCTVGYRVAGMRRGRNRKEQA